MLYLVIKSKKKIEFIDVISQNKFKNGRWVRYNFRVCSAWDNQKFKSCSAVDN